MSKDSSASGLFATGNLPQEEAIGDESKEKAQMNLFGRSYQISPTIQIAHMEHLAPTKKLADSHKFELGFINLAILRKAIESRSLLVALCPNGDSDAEFELAGMVHFYVRRDSTVTLCNIVVAQTHRRAGLGRRLFEELASTAGSLGKTQIRLKCPADLPANHFYERLGLRIVAVEPGKHRMLNVWSYTIDDRPPVRIDSPQGMP